MGLTFDSRKLQDRLNNMSKKLGTQAIDKVLDKGDEIVLEAMRDEVPKKTWELHNSLGKIKRKGSGFDRTSVIGIASNDRSIIERGYYQEHGIRGMVGKKWIRKGFLKAKNNAVSKMKDELKDTLMR
ncbi:MAG: hypothetical protein RR460_04370 [Clostridium sp.]